MVPRCTTHNAGTQKCCRQCLRTVYDISKKVCKNTRFIENIDELILNFDTNSCKIGITAGASTPQKLIDEVVSKIANKQ